MYQTRSCSTGGGGESPSVQPWALKWPWSSCRSHCCSQRETEWIVLCCRILAGQDFPEAFIVPFIHLTNILLGIHHMPGLVRYLGHGNKWEKRSQDFIDLWSEGPAGNYWYCAMCRAGGTRFGMADVRNHVLTGLWTWIGCYPCPSGFHFFLSPSAAWKEALRCTRSPEMLKVELAEAENSARDIEAPLDVCRQTFKLRARTQSHLQGALHP